MDDFVSRISKGASALSDAYEADLRGCAWAEQIPAFHRGATDDETSAQIRRHLVSCEECNLLLMALAVQSPPQRDFSWIVDGLHRALESALSFQDAFMGTEAPAMSVRGAQDVYSIAEERLPLPDGTELCISYLLQGETKILTIYTPDGACRRFDFFDARGNIIKAADNTKQIKIDMPDEEIVLVTDDLYKVRFEGGQAHEW